MILSKVEFFRGVELSDQGRILVPRLNYNPNSTQKKRPILLKG